MSNDHIAVVIPSIPVRARLLKRAFASALNQTTMPNSFSIMIDHNHDGAPLTRQRALDAVHSDADWVAFLDDDDEFMPMHLNHLLAHAKETDADYVFSWFECVDTAGQRLGSKDPVFPPTHFSTPWNPADPRQTTVTTLVRASLAREVGFCKPREDGDVDGQRAGEDWDFTLRCNELGKISHLVERTWLWHHDSGNTSGRGDRW